MTTTRIPPTTVSKQEAESVTPTPLESVIVTSPTENSSFILGSSVMGGAAAHAMYLMYNYVATDGKDIALRFVPTALTFLVGCGVSTVGIIFTREMAPVMGGLVVAGVGAPIAALDAGVSCIPEVPLWSAPIISTAAIGLVGLSGYAASRLSFWRRDSNPAAAREEEEKTPLKAACNV